MDLVSLKNSQLDPNLAAIAIGGLQTAGYVLKSNGDGTQSYVAADTLVNVGATGMGGADISGTVNDAQVNFALGGLVGFFSFLAPVSLNRCWGFWDTYNYNTIVFSSGSPQAGDVLPGNLDLTSAQLINVTNQGTPGNQLWYYAEPGAGTGIWTNIATL